MLGDDVQFIHEVHVGEVEAPSMDPNQELSNLKRKFESWKREFKVGGAACPPAQPFSLFPSIFPPSFLPNVCLQCFHCSLSLFLLLFFSLMFGGGGGGGAQQSAQVFESWKREIKVDFG